MVSVVVEGMRAIGWQEVKSKKAKGQREKTGKEGIWQRLTSMLMAM
jgi:hypothetical protein